MNQLYPLYILIFVFLFGCSFPFSSSRYNKSIDKTISVMTYNIRYGLADDGENSWEYRKDFLVSQINFYNPDFLGIQEALPFQLFYLDSLMPHHGFIGKSRDPDGQGEYSAILYNYEKFNLIEQHTFWLSSTSSKPSKGWDAAYPRICSYGLFEDKRNKTRVWIFNTHLDHVGIKARERSVELILEKIKKINNENYPLLLMGDMNAEPDSKPIQRLKYFLNDSKDISIAKPFGNEGTFNDFQFNKPLIKRIDYIFVSKNAVIKVNKYAVLSNSKNLKYPSDHLPVYAKLTVESSSR